MCEASAFFMKGDQEELLLEEVDLVEPEGADAYRIVNIFGEQKLVKGRIKFIKLVDHKIVFET